MPEGAAARQLQSQQTRTRLIEAAETVFSASGFERATVEDVAAAAGYSKGAYYFHFTSKEQMLLELVQQWDERRTERLQRQANAGQPPAVALVETLEALVSYEGESVDWSPLLIEFWSQALRNRIIRRRLTETYRRWRTILADVFARARDEGVLAADVDPATAAAMALALHDGLIVENAIKPPDAPAISPRRLVASFIAPLMPGREQETPS